MTPQVIFYAGMAVHLVVGTGLIWAVWPWRQEPFRARLAIRPEEIEARLDLGGG